MQESWMNPGMSDEKKKRWRKKSTMNEEKSKYQYGRNVAAWFIAARSIQWKLMIFFDSKKCILLQHTCGISIATMIASEKGLGSWSEGSLLFYTADTYTTKKKYTLISCDNSLFAYQYVSCSRNFSFLSHFFLFFFFFLFRFPSFSTRTDHKKIRI